MHLEVARQKENKYQKLMIGLVSYYSSWAKRNSLFLMWHVTNDYCKSTPN